MLLIFSGPYILFSKLTLLAFYTYLHGFLRRRPLRKVHKSILSIILPHYHHLCSILISFNFQKLASFFGNPVSVIIKISSWASDCEMASSSGPPPPATPQLTSNQPQPPGQGKANSQGRIQEGERGGGARWNCNLFFYRTLKYWLFPIFGIFILLPWKGAKGVRALFMSGE